MAGAYLAVVTSAFIFVALDVTRVEHVDASMSGVWIYLVTMPLSLVAVLFVPDSTGLWATVALFALPALCGLAQASFLWFALRGRRRTSTT